MRELTVETNTHGRVLIEDAAVSLPAGVLVGCHGYGQNADAMLEELRRIPGAGAWTLVSVQALHRFYTRNDQAVVASWMTRQDRELAIADNSEYLSRAVAAACGDGASMIVFVGFSQGASMAARAAARGARSAAGLIILGGDIPKDVKDDPAVQLPPVLIGCGIDDAWYGGRLDKDVQFLESRGIRYELVRFTGGHEFTEEFRMAAGRWLEGIAAKDYRTMR